MRSFVVVGPLSLIALLSSALVPANAQAQGAFQFQYVAKVVCANADTRGSLVPQAYATSINVNNSSDSLTVFLRKRLVITFPPGQQIPQKPLKPLNDSLPPTFALETDCQDLRKRYGLQQAFFEGFVVLQSTLQLDVTAVYTVPGGIDVVQVAERKVFVAR